ncbi:5-formyltetrahydrofolate cyclo-ligase [Actinobaculum suis]|uniref:5-formyltetrahydrofolate cyclo-ligase n=1 Tax=Actinobaculum suis TaxID=1657 RepID=A0A0K9EUW2_9ACTO|nr:5-formyltetrahydrofolate cyclo-ligase [Actinobaculum suis]KMY23666.1 5-formyltetrahydrofolate cyclo-ligase [Actinobaculum suis]MDY5153010.1 5-formyltetrahydrofolate cyclo-ligase [Actinobaculum suis]OCA93355.1 5-formyltetrahydrofolate cyclo-ligase [Actinobaculum suis]OCA96123.1 5-formyltetrahydrofolate cyclo-ligase [Actinobaculum suis]OCA96265.1 5-formyltetrahydrofolate cyclo-ligase [Actinobaculum suis]
MTLQKISYPDVSTMELRDAKSALRAKVREARASRGAARLAEAEKGFIAQALDYIGESKVIASYISVNQEPPTLQLCDEIISSGRRLLVPKLGPGLSREWAWYQGREDLSEQAPGRPPAPSGTPLSAEILADVDVVIIPALLVNHDGVRLGQGGGWYDRVLKQVPRNMPVAAMVFPEEFVDFKLPRDENDMPVHTVILPDRVVEL